ncbi:radical SAM protein [Streptomyces sp. NPDC050703]|uniref:radical SAM protein n=1 Tax=Streptomyces sp. NPDC050703 TaxID=3157218 RepID=UPI00342320AA
MHLLDLLAARPRPAAALLMTLTRRCPLSCAHCSTASATDSEQLDAAPLTAFAETFRPADRPDFLLLTGGEPLLRPRLVETLAGTARAAGVRTQLQTGMFFARDAAGGGRVPPPVADALAAVDHVSASLDVFHEAEVPRARVLDVLRALHEAGKDVSVQLTGRGPDDPYLAEATGDIRRALDDRVPILVARVRPAGRAAAWLPDAGPAAVPHGAAPCAMAAWPVVAFDGTVVACCNQNVVDGLGGRLPGHLRLGHVADDDWPTIRRRLLGRPLLRGIRTLGPVHLAGALAAAPGGAGPSGQGDAGYCGTCVGALGTPDAARAARARLRHAGARVLEREIGGLVERGGADGFLAGHGVDGYRDLARLGAPGHTAGAGPGRAGGVA